jgi:GTPase Era involved in 16S rRNA processing
MVESYRSSTSKSAEIPVYFVVGDSGAGKSTFINKLLGDEVAKVLIENPGGKSITQGAQIYTSDNPKFHIVDTQGTNDTSNSTNDSVLASVMNKFLSNSDFSKINGIIYIHDSNMVARCHYDLRCKELSKLVGN